MAGEVGPCCEVEGMLIQQYQKTLQHFGRASFPLQMLSRLS